MPVKMLAHFHGVRFVTSLRSSERTKGIKDE